MHVQKKNTLKPFFKRDEKNSFSSNLNFFGKTEFFIGIVEFSVLLYNVQNLNIKTYICDNMSSEILKHAWHLLSYSCMHGVRN